MDIPRFLTEMKAENPQGFGFATLMLKFGEVIDVPFVLGREGRGWEPTKCFNYDDFEPYLGRPVVVWHNIKTLCIVIEDADGQRFGIRQMPMRVPLFGFKPGALETLLDSIYHRSIGRTSDAGFKSAERRRIYNDDKSVPEEWFFKARVETPERRAAWGRVLIDGGRLALDLALSRTLDTGLHNCIKQGLLLKASLTGEEKFDRTAFLSVLSDLQATRDTLSA